ncbi:MAG: UDP-N-acetylmuramate dehydrogenase [Actinomycetota bacterium]|nr:UDP-N-acetylmuramate dehydrogenase [Actinomycetota bacterium]
MSGIDELWEMLNDVVDGRVQRDVPLAPLTTYRLGGPAAICVEPGDDDDLVAIAKALASTSVEVLTLGRGSNVVVSDNGWPGLVIRMGTAFSWVREGDGDREVRAGAAASLPVVANWAARRSLSGLEFFVAIPGSIGGAVRMNAGAHGASTSDHFVAARILDLRSGAVRGGGPQEMGFSYRTSSISPSDVVLDATFALVPSEESEIRGRMDGYRKHRAATQPPPVQNAGSVFKNPPGESAGRLVEAAGLKGFAVGGASVSELHANFFIAGPEATAQDVFDLVHAVKERVRSSQGVDLTPEIHFAGAFDKRPSKALS